MAALLGLGMTACTSAAPTPAAWVEPADYTFTLEASCGERSLLGRFRVLVEDGALAGVEPLDAAAGRVPAEVLGADAVPTLGGLLELAARARREADGMTLTLDPSDGHPVAVEIDWEAQAIDDEECYRVLDYTPTGE